MTGEEPRLSLYERALSVFTKVRGGEGPAIALFCTYAFLVMFSFYIMRSVRDGIMLAEGGAAGRAYVNGFVALTLMFAIPAYSALRRHIDGPALVNAVTALFVVVAGVFALLSATDIRIGIAFYFFASLYGIVLVAHFWGLAADSLNLKSGQRLFPLILLSANLGAIIGGLFAGRAREISLLGLLIVAAIALASTLLLTRRARAAVPEGSRAVAVAREPHPAGLAKVLGGLALVWNDKYLRLVAVLTVLLNFITTTGEYILGDVVVRWADDVVAGGGGVGKREVITEFYGNLNTAFTLLGLGLQAVLVSRVFRLIGVSGAILVMPVIAVLSYGLIAFLPIFALIAGVRILESAVSVSLMNTVRQALFLPTSRAAKYDGKMTIDTFFWRVGDLVSALAVFVGVGWLALGAVGFAAVNMVAAAVWLAVAWRIGRQYHHEAKVNVTNVAPELNKPIPDAHWLPGQPFRHQFDPDTFVDADPGDVLTLRAQLRGGGSLPQWLVFDSRRRLFYGDPPTEFIEEIHIEVYASDVDGFEASGTFVIRPGHAFAR
jgi:ATP:ADP antiporter, AAA family